MFVNTYGPPVHKGTVIHPGIREVDQTLHEINDNLPEYRSFFPEPQKLFIQFH